MIPHITNEIKSTIRRVAQDVDVAIIEIGGTVGDIESLPFLESIRQMRNEVGRENSIFVHLTLVPYIATSGELKTKPTQHSVKELREIGIQPDILLCRTDRLLPTATSRPRSPCSAMSPKRTSSPLWMSRTSTKCRWCCHSEGLDGAIVRYLNLPAHEPDLHDWKDLIREAMIPGNP